MCLGLACTGGSSTVSILVDMNSTVFWDTAPTKVIFENVFNFGHPIDEFVAMFVGPVVYVGWFLPVWVFVRRCHLHLDMRSSGLWLFSKLSFTQQASFRSLDLLFHSDASISSAAFYALGNARDHKKWQWVQGYRHRNMEVDISMDLMSTSCERYSCTWLAVCIWAFVISPGFDAMTTPVLLCRSKELWSINFESFCARKDYVLALHATIVFSLHFCYHFSELPLVQNIIRWAVKARFGGPRVLRSEWLLEDRQVQRDRDTY